MNALLITVPALPLLAVPGVGLLGPMLRWRGAELLAGATALALIALLLLRGQAAAVQAAWFPGGPYQLTVGLTLDALTWFVAMVVTTIALVAAVYAAGYMADEANGPRFFAELALFVGAMLTLVLASSLILLFAAWEAVGVASYLLIGFRTADSEARAAATKAFLMTRIGDFGFLLGWLLLLLALHTTDIGAVLAAASRGMMAPGLLTLIALLIFLAPIGKSAQLPLAGWLADAMVAPTPVSALLHSATMVAAGIYLLLRLYPLFAATPGAPTVIFAVGAATAVFSALVAAGENDLKRILAWSTSSQLGEMMLAIGLGGPFAATLHFAMHAGFKATLFLAAGAVDKRAGSRDLARLGGLWRALPVAGIGFLVGALLLAGLQPLPRGSSDDAIVAAALGVSVAAGLVVAALVFLGGHYIGRAGGAVFLGPRAPMTLADGGRSNTMRAGILGLAALSVLGGIGLSLSGQVLPFAPPPEPPAPWRAGLLLAGAAGLIAGAWPLTRARLDQVAARISAALGHALGLLVAAPARFTAGLAGLAVSIEDLLDRAVRAIAAAAWAAATTSETVERGGFAAGGNELAGLLRGAGGRLRQTESGLVYLNTLTLIAWSLLVLIAGGVLFWF